MAKILIVHAHHEPKSFTSALARAAAETLTEQGHKVDFSDLYAMKFDPVSDRRNFTTVRDPNFFKQQQEELYAAEHLGFAPEIEMEMQKTGTLRSSGFFLSTVVVWATRNSERMGRPSFCVWTHLRSWTLVRPGIGTRETRDGAHYNGWREIYVRQQWLPP